MQNNKENIAIIAKALGELCQEVVFVGGATVEFYADTSAPEVRPTDDIDCVIELATRADYYRLEEKLRAKGFQNDITGNPPLICRWRCQGLIVDIMPTDETILGFSNRWYTMGIRHAKEIALTDSQHIKIFASSLFLATKMEAFQNRGKKDFRGSKDFEDIIFLLDNNKTILQDLLDAPEEVKTFVSESAKAYLKEKHIREYIECALPYGSSDAHISKIEKILQEITSL